MVLRGGNCCCAFQFFLSCIFYPGFPVPGKKTGFLSILSELHRMDLFRARRAATEGFQFFLSCILVVVEAEVFL